MVKIFFNFHFYFTLLIFLISQVEIITASELFNQREDSLIVWIANGESQKAIDAIKSGAAVNRFDGSMSPLYFAADKGNNELIEIFLKYGAKINYENGPAKRTALHQAVLKGHVNTVKLLIRKGANINVKNSDKRTPLSYAMDPPIWHANNPNHKEIIRILKDNGAIIDESEKRRSSSQQKLYDSFTNKSNEYLFISDKDKFKVLFPNKPEEIEQKNISVIARAYQANRIYLTGFILFSVVVTKSNKNLPLVSNNSNKDIFLNSSLDEYVKSLSNNSTKLLSEKSKFSNIYSSIDFKIKYSYMGLDWLNKGFFVLRDNNILYRVSLSYSDYLESQIAKVYSEFINSFSFY